MTQSQAPTVDYSGSKYPVRPEIVAAHQEMLASFASAGTWWTGAERLAIAVESRAARDCGLCAERKKSLSPFAVDGQHDGLGTLAPAVVDVIHRIVTETKKEAKQRSRELVAEALVRCASEQTAASTVSTFELPSEDLKGRIIGREGRNIRSFEKTTGVDVSQ